MTRLFFVRVMVAALLGCQAQPRPTRTLYAYTARWCKQCQADKPALCEIARMEGVRLVVVDVDALPNGKVMTVPTYTMEGIVTHDINVIRRAASR